jgi:uncharacterized protein YdeI (YjbR/CyaY-like superfamily)
MSDGPVYFENAAALRQWFAKNATTAQQLVVGYLKAGTGLPSITWRQSVDEALCVGWIDGVRHRVDDERYRIRFTPRRPISNWSDVNIKRVHELIAECRMTPAGLAAFEQRKEAKSRTASYEQEAPPELGPGAVKYFKQHATAWSYYETTPPSYRKRVTWWIMSAKQPTTREKRLAAVVQACAQGKRL